MFDRTFIQVARSLAVAKSLQVHPEEAAQQLYGMDASQAVSRVLKAAVDPSDTTSHLFQPNRVTQAFVDAVKARTVLGRMRVVPVPFKTSIPWLTQSTTADFVGESVPIAVTVAAASAPIDLAAYKVSGLVVMTNELLAHSDSEAILERDLVQIVSEAIDRRFLDPTSGAVARVRPASITSGLTPIDASVVASANEVDGLLSTMVDELVTAGSNLLECVWACRPSVALSIAALRDSGGGRAFPELSPLGGTLMGFPVLVSASAPAGALVLVDASEVLVADNGAAEIMTSQNAMLIQSDDPENDSNRVSMFQAEATALRVSRWISWQLRRPLASIATGLDIALPDLSE